MAEPSLPGQLAELLLLTLLANAALLARKAVSATLKEGSSFFLEGIRRDSPPGLQLENLSSAGAYDLGGTCLVVGVQHFLGALLCLPEVTRNVSNDWSAALIRHAALLAAALGLTQVLAAVRRHLAEDGPKHMPLSLLAYLVGLHAISIVNCVPMNLHYSTEYAYVLMVFGMHLSGFAANFLSPLAWTIDDSYLPHLPLLWLIGTVDTVIAVAVRGPLLIYSIVMMKRLWFLDGAWLLLLTGTVGTLLTVPVCILLLLGSLGRFNVMMGRAQIKDALAPSAAGEHGSRRGPVNGEMPAQVDAVETALERELQRRAVQNVGQPETVRKIYDASDSSAAKGPAVPNVAPVTAGRMFGDIHNLKEEVAKGGKPEVGTNTVALQKKFSDNFFGKIAKNKYFEGITISVIFLNALAIGVDADFSARNEVPANLYEGDVFFIVLEVFFASYFTFEILIRFLAYRQKCHCLRDGWFVFDLLLVLMMVWETWIMPFVGLDSGLGQLSILRLLRLLRITRMAKLMRAFPQLMMIIKGISAAARAVGWTAILLVIISFTWSILFTNEYHQGHITDDEMKEWADDDPRKIHEYFGGMDKSMLTLLIMGTILDDVTECADIIHAQNNIWMLAAFIFYILLNSFMMLNMLVGILVEVNRSQSPTSARMGALHLWPSSMPEESQSRSSPEAPQAPGGGRKILIFWGSLF
ncbi:Cacna1g [Symbiodinium microadriaticum]|nr:Cacna1g [Symbiodinium microadriaticum]